MLRPRAYWLGDQWVEPAPYDIAGTPCEGVIRSGRLFQIPDRVVDHYPQYRFLSDNAMVSYTGMPFKDADGQIIGHLAVLDTKPVPHGARYGALFEIFGTQASAGRISGPRGAAVRLGLKASTLRSQMKALGIAGS